MSILSVTLGSAIMTWGNTFSFRLLTESDSIERLWALVPVLVLLAISIPSLRLLYQVDESGAPSVTVKGMGHQ